MHNNEVSGFGRNEKEAIINCLQNFFDLTIDDE